MNYPCAKFSDFGFIVRTDTQTDTQNHRRTARITEADDRTERGYRRRH